MGARLTLETSAARLVGRLSRAAGRGGGTTLPGKLVWKLDPGALDALAARLSQGVVLVSATNGKTTTTAMASSILSPTHRLAWNHSGANLASGVASTLLAARDADLGLLEVDEFVLPEVMRRTSPRVVCLGNLFRDQLDRYGELEHIAERWRAPSPASAEGRRSSRTPTTRSSPRSRRDAREHSCSASTIRDWRAPAPARVRLEVLRALRAALSVRRRLRGPSRRLPLRPRGHDRPPFDVAARDIRPEGLEGVSFSLGRRRERRPSARGAGSLQRLQRARGRLPRPRARGSARSRPRASGDRRRSGDSSVSGWPTAACSCCS